VLVVQDERCILIVEDEHPIADALQHIVHDLGLGVCHVAATVDEAVKAAKQHRPLLVIMDLELKGQGDGVDAAKRIHEDQGCPIIFTTGHTEAAALQRILQDNPAAVLKKPFSAEELMSVVWSTLESRHDQ
jgi:two-component system, response regulator PdtaR